MKPKLSFQQLLKFIRTCGSHVPTVIMFLILFALSPAPHALSQIPQGFNYQAIVRDGVTKQPIVSQPVLIRVTIEDGIGTDLYQEIHSLSTDEFGIISIIIGQGTPQGAAAFDEIDWNNEPLSIKTELQYPVGGSYTEMGTAPLMSVPYAMVADSLSRPLAKLAVTGETEDMEEALFEVKNKDGNTVFAVYNEGVRIYVGDGDTKGPKGGFAIGGFGSLKDENNKRYLFVDDDSVRIYLNGAGKAAKGGFAIGGYGTVKGDQKFLTVSYDSVRIYVDNDETDKGVKGGFAIGGYGATKGKPQKLLTVSDDSVRIYINDAGKGPKGGFAIGGFDKTKGEGNNTNFFNVSTSADDTINPSQNRILWYPVKNAFLTGKVLVELPDSVGENSFASGFESKAIGNYSQALGYQAIARKDYSTAIGYQAVANKVNSFAFGQWANAKNEESYAFGRGATAEGFRSYAFGSAGVDSAGAVTDATYAKGDYSVAIGQGSQSIGKGSFSFGLGNTTDGDYSLAVGYKNKSTGFGSTAIGYSNTASEMFATSLGAFNKSTKLASVSMGYATQSTAVGSVSMGEYTLASGRDALAFGEETKARGMRSLAFGYFCDARGENSIAGGSSSQADSQNGIAIGDAAYAKSKGSIALQDATNALGLYSLASGTCTTARGKLSVTMGYCTLSRPYAAVVIGSYNDTTICYSATSWDTRDPIFIIGNSQYSGSRQNALVVMKDGKTGLNNVYPTQILDVNGNARIRSVTSGAWAYNLNLTTDGTLTTASSDISMKENICDIADALKKVSRLRGVFFTWKSDSLQKPQIGMIAQEVEQVIPELVFTNPSDGLKGVNYQQSVSLLVEAIKEQQVQIEELKELISRMEEQIASSSP